MPCYNRMKRIFLQGLLWLYLLGFGFTALSLEPGFLDFDNLPDTNFTCVGKVIGGYYADLETNCQMFHVCTIGQLDEPMDIRFLCLNGTVFDQETRVCERIDEVDCSKSEQFYSLNLELYGNSQPSNLEENYETEQPLIIKSTTTTSTTTAAPKKTTKFSYFTTLPPLKSTSQKNQLHPHRFPGVNPNSPDIRFNPEEINISLHPGAPPDIRTKPFFTEKKVTNSDKKVQVVIASDSDKQSTASSLLQSGYNRPSDINFEFAFDEVDDVGYGTETSPQEYQFHREFRPSQQYSDALHNSGPHHYKPTTYHTPTTQKIQIYHSKSPTTMRNYYIPHLKPPAANQHSHYIQHRTEKPPQRLQLPLPLLPTLPPLTFSSPAPFSLQHHIETKRYTKEHIPPPRIIISASASVSDASGRRLNYSLGTIGAANILEEPPASYDDYKETDVVLDPFYHDVPKIKNGRRKRSTEGQLKHSDIIKSDEEAVTVLKFLFDWYRNEKTNPARLSTTPLSVPLPSEDIARINEELRPEEVYSESKENEEIDFKFQNSDLFNKHSKYSIVGEDAKNLSVSHDLQDYVDDNYEPQTYKETYNKSKYQIENPEYNNEEAKNYSLALDYVDDNVEPIFYQERYPLSKKDLEPSKSKSTNTTEDVTTESNEEIIGTEQTKLEESTITLTPYNLALEDFTVSANEFHKQPFKVSDSTKDVVEDDKRTVKTEVSFVTKVSEEDNSVRSTTPSLLYIEVQDEALSKDKTVANNSLEELTPTPTTENVIETNAISKHTRSFEKESFTIKPVRVKPRNGSRGRRRFNTIETTTREPITFKNVLIEKLVKKPYTAKDDYDFLRTLSNVHSSTFRSAFPEDTASLTKESEFYSTATDESTTEFVRLTEEPLTELLTSPIESVPSDSTTTTTTTETTTSATTTATASTPSNQYTERSRNSNRRGRTRFNGESNHKSGRRRKPSRNYIDIEEHHTVNISANKNENGTNDIGQSDHDINVSASVVQNYTSDINVALPTNRHSEAVATESHSSQRTEESFKYLPNLKSILGENKSINWPITADKNTEVNLPILKDDTQKKRAKNVKDNLAILEDPTQVPFIKSAGANLLISQDHIQKTFTEGTTVMNVEVNLPILEDYVQKTLAKSARKDAQTYLPIFDHTQGTLAKSTGTDTEVDLSILDSYTQNISRTNSADINSPVLHDYAQKTLVKDAKIYLPIVEYHDQKTDAKSKARAVNLSILEDRAQKTLDTETNLPILEDYAHLPIFEHHQHTYIKNKGDEVNFPILEDHVQKTSSKYTPNDAGKEDLATTSTKGDQKDANNNLPVLEDRIQRTFAKSVSKAEEPNLPILEYFTQTIPAKSVDKNTEHNLPVLEDRTKNITKTTDGQNVDFSVPVLEDRALTTTTGKNIELVEDSQETFVQKIDKLTESVRTSHHNSLKTVEPLPEIIPTTTEQIYTPRYRSRGRKTFLDQFSLALTSQSLERGTTQATPTAQFLQNLGTPSSLPTPETVASGTTSSIDRNRHSQIDNIADIYATSFVPTEAVHVTKKKQLKDPELTEIGSTLVPTESSTMEEQTKMIITVDEDNEKDATSTTNVEEISTVKLKEDQLPTTLWSDVTTARTEQQDNKSILDYSTDIYEKTDVVSTTDSTVSEIETRPPTTLWTNKNFEKFIKDVESTTKGIIASAEKVFNKIGKPIEERFKNYFNYYNVENGQENEVRDLTTEKVAEPADAIQTFPETTTDNVYPPTYPETTRIVIGEKTTTDGVITAKNTVTDTTVEASTSTEPPTTFDLSTTETAMTKLEQFSTTYSSRGSRRRKPSDYQRDSYMHRFFSTEQFTRRPENSRHTIEVEIIDALTKNSQQLTTKASILRHDIQEVSTDAPLWRSANPTQSKRFRDPLLTTPLSRKMSVKKHYFFNCFNKEIDKFYADPRDCRLFHYCTQGYNKNQLLDMKFVCDLNTYFDDENLVCTKKKPKRCL